MTRQLQRTATPEITRRWEEAAAGITRPARALPVDPRLRLGLATAAVIITAVLVDKRQVGQREATVFRAFNGLPDSLYRPAWAVMQFGTFGTAPAAAGVALLAHERELARRLLLAGTGTWALAKVIKRVVRRPRPAKLMSDTRCRGTAATGLGYLSGHAGVAAALGAAAASRLGPAGRVAVLGVAPTVGLTRMYVGAHLPLDVVGGAALGLGVEAAVSLLSGPSGREPTIASRQAVGSKPWQPRAGGVPPRRAAVPRGWRGGLSGAG